MATTSPVADVGVYALYPDGGYSVVGATSAQGLIAMPHRNVEGEEYLFVHSNYAALRCQLDFSGNNRQRVSLSPGARLYGQVVAATGPVEAGVRVLAWPVGRRPTRQGFLAAAAGDPRFRVACTDVEGQYSIPGLMPGTAYYMVAAGRGYLSEKAAGPIYPEDSPVVVPASFLYGAVVSLVEEDGGGLRTSPRVTQGWGGVTCYFRTAGITPLPFRDYALLGGLPAEPSPSAGSFDRQILGWSRLPVVEAPTAGVVAAVAGYVTERVEVACPLLRDELARYRVRLRPQAAGWGELKLRFVASEELLRVTRDVAGPLGHLLLRSSDSGLLRLAVEHTGAEALGFSGVPYGEYEWRFEPSTQMAAVPAQKEHSTRLVVGPEPATVLVDMRPFGAIRLALAAPGGQLWSGNMEVVISRDNRKGEVFWRFWDPPYVLWGLPEGEYTLAVSDPISGQSLLPTPLKAVVQAGGVTSCGGSLAAPAWGRH